MVWPINSKFSTFYHLANGDETLIFFWIPRVEWISSLIGMLLKYEKLIAEAVRQLQYNEPMKVDHGRWFDMGIRSLQGNILASPFDCLGTSSFLCSTGAGYDYSKFIRIHHINYYWVFANNFQFIILFTLNLFSYGKFICFRNCRFFLYGFELIFFSVEILNDRKSPED